MLELPGLFIIQINGVCTSEVLLCFLIKNLKLSMLVWLLGSRHPEEGSAY